MHCTVEPEEIQDIHKNRILQQTEFWARERDYFDSGGNWLGPPPARNQEFRVNFNTRRWNLIKTQSDILPIPCTDCTGSKADSGEGCSTAWGAGIIPWIMMHIQFSGPGRRTARAIMWAEAFISLFKDGSISSDLYRLTFARYSLVLAG